MPSSYNLTPSGHVKLHAMSDTIPDTKATLLEISYVSGSYSCQPDTLLRTVCRAYLHKKREDLTESEAMIAHLAGYDVSDRSGAVWKSGEGYRQNTGLFTLHWPPFSIKTQPDTIEVPRAEIEALKKRIAELEKGTT